MDMLGGGGEGMAESVLGEEFLLVATEEPIIEDQDFGKNVKSRIPAPSSTFTRNIPEVNWSISREDSPTKQSPRDHGIQNSDIEVLSENRADKISSGIPVKESRQVRGSQSTSRLPDPLSRDEPRKQTRNSTSQLPSYQRSTSTDSDSR